jgi:hypothetical protein
MSTMMQQGSGVIASTGGAPASFDIDDHFQSVGDRIIGTKIDKAIENAAAKPLPQQGETIGDRRFQHLAHIPMFSMYSTEQDAAHAKVYQRKQDMAARLKPKPQMSGGEKVALVALQHLSGGVNIDSKRKMDNRLQGMSVITKQRLVDQSHKAIITRWAIAPATNQDIWFVDVLEYHKDDNSSWSGNPVFVHTGKKASLKLLTKVVKNVQPKKGWRKRWNFQRCDSVSYIGEDGVEVPMEIVARDQRAISAIEVFEMQKRFYRDWVVPDVSSP